jgi:hypothetical protein
VSPFLKFVNNITVTGGTGFIYIRTILERFTPVNHREKTIPPVVDNLMKAGYKS